MDKTLIQWDPTPESPEEEFESWKRMLMKVTPEDPPTERRRTP